MSEIEREYAKQDLLPTIGIEIEVPEKDLNQDRVEILNRLGIKNKAEMMDDLWEVNPDYSYSPLAQSRLLQELAVMGAILMDSLLRIE